MTYAKWLDKFKDTNLDNLETSIEQLDLPLEIQLQLLEIIDNKEEEILEHMYIQDYSGHADNCYEEYKERDI